MSIFKEGRRHRLHTLLKKTPPWRFYRRVEGRVMEVVNELTRVTNDGSYRAHHDVAVKTRQEPRGARKGGLKGG